MRAQSEIGERQMTREIHDYEIAGYAYMCLSIVVSVVMLMNSYNPIWFAVILQGVAIGIVAFTLEDAMTMW